MDPSIASAAGNVIGSAIGSIGKGPKRQYKYARKMFDYQAAYNHPTQQMQRLKDAGLNPNLVYGEGTKGATGQQTGMDSIDFSQGGLEGLGEGLSGGVDAYYNTKNAQLKTEQQAIQNSLLGIERNLKGDQAYTERGILQDQFDFASSYDKSAPQGRFTQLDTDEFNYQADARRLQSGLIKQRYLNNQIDLEIKDATKADQIKQIANNALMAMHGATLREQEALMKKAEAQIFKHVPRETVSQVLNILRFLILRK